MPTVEPLPSSVVESWHIGLGAQQCVWLLVAISATISAAIPGYDRRSHGRRIGNWRFFDPLLAMRQASVAELPENPRHDPAHCRQKAQQKLSRCKGASRNPVRADGG